MGSINVDLALECVSLPGPGETVSAVSSNRSGGGKGANQAAAASRAGGAPTTMVGAVGDDADGRDMVQGLRDHGVDVSGVATVPEAPTGLAVIAVDSSGENSIVVVPGANAALSIDAGARGLISEADVVISPLENPQRVITEAARARRAGATFILNAAPAVPLDEDLLAEVDLLVVNEHEARTIAGEADVDAAVAVLVGLVPAVLVTLGAAGSRLHRRDRDDTFVPAPQVDVLDTTAAGDTYCGVLAARLAAGAPIAEAMLHATAAASLAVQRAGAQESVPTKEETRARLAAVRAEEPTHG